MQRIYSLRHFREGGRRRGGGRGRVEGDTEEGDVLGLKETRQCTRAVEKEERELMGHRSKEVRGLRKEQRQRKWQRGSHQRQRQWRKERAMAQRRARIGGA
ncbi:hypothetical protein Scep_019281 [Stephania cephalantha]|uniref:Uncharacterized protein n=1 Tax=Stephania cephalantha TaxID=152367 RepID=A0AAP0IAR3_9MAGN